MWPRFSSVTATAGSRDVVITSGESASNVLASDALIIGSFQLEEIESVLAGANGKTIIRLLNAWSNNTISQPAVVVPNPGDLRRARQALKDMEQLGIDTLVALNAIATKPEQDFVTIQDAAGVEYQVPTTGFYQRKIDALESAGNSMIASKKAEFDSVIGQARLLTVGSSFYMRTGADMEAMRAENLRRFAASGFVHMGKSRSEGDVHVTINEGMSVLTNRPNLLALGSHGGNIVGNSKTPYAVVNIGGFLTKLSDLSARDDSGHGKTTAYLKFPEAEAGTRVYDSATGESIDYRYDVDPKYGDVAGTHNEAVARAFGGLVANHDFRLGTQYWVAQPGSSVAIVNGELEASIDTGWARVGQKLLTASEYNRKVRVCFEAYASSSGTYRVVDLAPNSGGTPTIPGMHLRTHVTTEKSRYAFEITGDGTAELWLNLSSETAGEQVYVSNIEISFPEQEVVVSPVDLAGLEGFLERVTIDNPFVYPNGLIQSQATTMDGIATTTSARPDSYYAVYEGDTTSRGKSVNFFTATMAEQDTMMANPWNNLWNLGLDANGDPIIAQWRIRQRTFRGGNGDWWTTTTANDASNLLAFDEGFKSRVVPQGSSDTAEAFTAGIDHYVTSTHSNAYKDEQGVFVIRDTGPNKSRAYDGLCFFLPICTVSRLNQGAYHKKLNPMGTATYFSRTTGQTSTNDRKWYDSDAKKPRTTKDCFLGTTVTGTVSTGDVAPFFYMPNGSISRTASSSSRPDGRFYDAIYASGLGGVDDLRLSAWGVTDTGYARVKQELIAGTYRGAEKLKQTRIVTQYFDDDTSGGWSNGLFTAHNSLGDTISIRMSAGTPLGVQDIGVGSYVQVGDNEFTKVVFVDTSSNRRIEIEAGDNESTRVDWLRDKITTGAGITVIATADTSLTVSGEFQVTEVIADPVNILQCDALKDGWLGVWNPTIPDGVASIELTRKSLDTTVSQVYTADLGATWQTSNTSVDGVKNTRNPIAAGAIVIFPYTAFANPLVECGNSPVQDGEAGIGNVWAGCYYDTRYGGGLIGALTGKVATSNLINQYQSLGLNQWVIHTVDKILHENSMYPTLHIPISLNAPSNNSPGVKFLDTRSVVNNQAFLDLHFMELAHDGTDWGDPGKIVIADKTSTYTNDNGDVLLCGTKRLVKPIGWIHNTY